MTANIIHETLRDMIAAGFDTEALAVDGAIKSLERQGKGHGTLRRDVQRAWDKYFKVWDGA